MSEEPIRLGIAGLDGHGLTFTSQINERTAELGMRIVTALPLPTRMMSAETLAERVEATEANGARIVDSPEALAEDVDGLLCLADDGSAHLETAERLVGLGKPLFVDKPFEATRETAEALAALCEGAGCPVFSASALRYTPELQAVKERCAEERIVSAMVYSPYNEQATMPGWIYYGVHAVEPLFELMGGGCASVRCVRGAAGPVAVGRWRDGRIGMAHALTRGAHDYGFAVWGEASTAVREVEKVGIYDGLFRKIAGFMSTGESPVPPAQSVEAVAFMEAANRSMNEDGREVEL